MFDWSFDREDEQIFDELRCFIPDRVFDIHAHIYRQQDLKPVNGGFFSEGPQELSIMQWKEHMERQVGKDRLAGGLFFPYPVLYGDIDQQNNFILEQLKTQPECRGLMLVTPDTPRDRAEEYLKSKQTAGFKVYYLFSREENFRQASVKSYAPEWLWKLADGYGAIIMLHLVKDGAVADPENQKEILELCGKYPNVKLILAHAGRGFHWYNTLNGVHALKDLKNIWFDTSSICECGALKAILNEFGPERLLWGSDFPISAMRGKCVTAGNSFLWLLKDTLDWESSGCKPVLVGMEALRALRDAAVEYGLSKNEVEAVFCGNALKILLSDQNNRITKLSFEGD